MLYFARWKIALIVLVIFAGFITTLPNFFSAKTLESWPDFLPKKQMVLGLDLQGGAYLLYEVDQQDYINKRLQSLVGEIRVALREQPRIGYTGLGVQGDGAQVRIRDLTRLNEAEQRLEELRNPLVSSLFGGQPVDEFDIAVNDDGLIRFTYSEAGLDNRLQSIVQQSIEVIRRRVDEIGTTEPNIQRQGTDRILVEAPGEADPERLKDLVGQTAQLTFHMVDTSMSAEQALQNRPPVGTIVRYSIDDPPLPYLLEESPLLSGEDLVDAQVSFDQRSNEPVVNFRFNTSGARKFSTITQQNVGRPFAIVLDEEVISAPVIREPITGGSGQISGSFTVDGANDLAVLLRAGALPAKLTVIEERSIGPGLGADSIAAGEVASIIAGSAVIIFMILAYGRFGVIADLALVANILLIFGALTTLQATLTLPGIAGIVLTIGMAVDANVLIFERIREEARAGRSAITAIDAGYKRALGTILDANVTTLIAAVILFQLGSGPVRGFAVTLAIGIFTTVFSAFTFSRLLVAIWVRTRRPSKLPI
ncbi:preprotein translocase subunit SecD/SecD/SecF fusion protein [Roseibium hamelinense]|uniref:Protein translocase subunit SecD n=1 Tax=Roseibium hamelinense TaxID=150831 RepID=A0A562THN1_9HYPH|nr:protein translocase subunit SecD [Roseibium hamelinense]MTI45682.1 protein translocase subunit SecD [Roseibium hamelinense]TWI93135.1 preprotein translocase subunit SecD/SecD/SecF fusion protein [Roseibium hamelinense]